MNLSQYLPLFLITLFGSLGDPTRANNSQPIPVPERGENVCAFPKKKIQFVLRRNATTTTKVKIVDCGIPSFPDLECKEEINTSTIHWYPFRKAVSYNIYDCCPGWTGYVPRVGCKKRVPCRVAIPQNVPAHCRGKRSKDLQKQRALYKLGHMRNLPFPMSDINPSLLINLTLSDPFSGPWMKLYGYMLNLNLHLIENYPKSHKKEFSKISDYEKVYHFFMKQQQNNARLHPFFRFPSQEELFKDVVNNVTWRDDRVFAEQRLAGLNPMALMKVTVDQGSIGVGWTELQQRLNPNYDWDQAVGNSMAKKIKLEDAIKEGSVFVAQFPLFDNISTVPDITEPRPTRKMWPSMSPIALFASRPGDKGAPAQLRPVAIQLDYTPGSQVYSPDDGDLWVLAKESFQVTDFAYVEMVEHLLRTHLLMEPFCVCFLRHVSKLHPLHQLMKFHCRGLIPTNKIGFPKLVGDKAYMHQLFATGNTGAISLLVRAYMTLTWADTDFKAKNKARGINDRSKLPYFPYRDDGEVIYEAMADLVNDYINFYYAADQDVLQDHEIQALANEISSMGLGNDGGKGKLRGFPRKIETKSELKDIITRLIWTSTAQHTAVNYPIAVYGAYTPNMPTKIYDDDRVPFDVFNPYRLPNGVVSAVQAGVAMSLGSLRLDRLFDYGTQLSDRAGGVIVNSHYNRLHSVVKPLLNKRNSQRFQEGYLTYPYLSPAWIPNSICT
ncbi:polyunsaturated fatty acid 5-lipoxygenase-like [Montipora foliosa]|uniref:polyunsaturated fatty acid 5-lipoxygenase-like n=1 Tax=Montipora foliosa TaxID=591990 RepID=UPI0035F1A810